MSVNKDGSFVYDKDVYSCLCLNVPSGTNAGQKWFYTPEELCEYIKLFPEGAVFSVIYEKTY